MMSTFVIDYYLLDLTSSFGVIQISASLGGLKGLLLFRSRYLSRGFGLAVALTAFVWFFVSESRNVNDYEGGLDANVQALTFFLGAVSALVMTLVVTSLTNAHMSGDPSPGEGLEVLRRTNYARALGHSIRYWWRGWRTQTRSYFSG